MEVEREVSSLAFHDRPHQATCCAGHDVRRMFVEALEMLT